MYYKGKNINLAEFLDVRKKDYKDKPDWMWNDEGVVHAIIDYHSSMGVFSDEDIQTLKKLGLEDLVDFCEITI